MKFVSFFVFGVFVGFGFFRFFICSFGFFDVDIGYRVNRCFDCGLCGFIFSGNGRDIDRYFCCSFFVVFGCFGVFNRSFFVGVFVGFIVVGVIIVGIFVIGVVIGGYVRSSVVFEFRERVNVGEFRYGFSVFFIICGVGDFVVFGVELDVWVVVYIFSVSIVVVNDVL